MDEGGLGVRDLVTVNKASIPRHVRNIESYKKNSLGGMDKEEQNKRERFLGVENPV